MPVPIACPKCQTRYMLPDQALGKPVKCKSCGTVFKTKAPVPNAPGSQASQQPSGQSPAQGLIKKPAQPPTSVSNPELAKFGIDGPLSRPADIFAGAGAPPPQMGNPLGNFVLEDPGFADLKVVQEQVQEEMGGEDGMAAILNNPYMNVGKGSNRGRRRINTVDVSGYAVARVGMWMVYVSWGLMLGITVFFALFGTIARLAPQETLQWIAEKLGPTIAQALLWIMFTFFWIWVASVGVIFMGQILCIFAPKNDEKLFAGLTVGSIVGAFVLFFVMLLMGAFAGAFGNADGAAQAVFGIFMLFTILGIYALLLASMFFFMTYFKRIGKNINAKQVVDAAKTAMLTWIGAIAIGIISSIATGVLMAIYAGEDSAFLVQVMDIVGIVNLFLFIAVMGTLLMMVRSAIDHTRPG